MCPETALIPGGKNLLKYIIKRLLLLIPVVFGITFIIFVVLNLAPGDPAAMILGQDATAEALAAKRAEMGLDQPIVIQYIRYIAGVLRGDFGTSWLSGYEVLPEFLHRIPYTILLGSLSMFVAVIIGIPLGIIAAIRQYHFVDYASLALALILFSLPSFWFAMMGQILFCLTLGWLPAAGVGSLAHFILPSITLGANILASQLRMTRTSMLVSSNRTTSALPAPRAPMSAGSSRTTCSATACCQSSHRLASPLLPAWGAPSLQRPSSPFRASALCSSTQSRAGIFRW